MSDEIRLKFLADYPGKDPNPTLWDLLHDEEPPFEPRTDAENKVFAAMPGDDLSEHPLGPHTDNPYFGKPYAELKALLEGGGLDRETQVQVLSALQQHDLQHLHPHTTRIR